jgi:chemotaxis family two-component system sensor kinase Cph1
MKFERGDHICLIYSSARELVMTVRDFIVDGLAKRERCWYVASGGEDRAIRAALRSAGVDISAEVARGALRLIPATRAYLVHGEFDPEATVRVFNDAIEETLAAGFSGFRAAADMSWALEATDGIDHLITYEALLRMLFENCQVIGLCLYDRRRMPLRVIDGALATHPLVYADGASRQNPLYLPASPGPIE